MSNGTGHLPYVNVRMTVLHNHLLFFVMYLTRSLHLIVSTQICTELGLFYNPFPSLTIPIPISLNLNF